MPRLTLHNPRRPQRGCRLHPLTGIVNARTAVGAWLPLHEPTQRDMLDDHPLPKYFSLSHGQPPAVIRELCALTWYILKRPEFTLLQFGTPTATE